jgi:hypothetical protein
MIKQRTAIGPKQYPDGGLWPPLPNKINIRPYAQSNECEQNMPMEGTNKTIKTSHINVQPFHWGSYLT